MRCQYAAGDLIFGVPGCRLKPEEIERTSRSVSGAELGVRRLWRFVARSEAGRPTPMCRVLTLLAARGQTGSGGTGSGSGSADREVTGKPVRG
jgi:hypothetical protein